MYLCISITVTLLLSFVFILILPIAILGFYLFFYADLIPDISYSSHMYLFSSLLSTQPMLISMHISMSVCLHFVTASSYGFLFFTLIIFILLPCFSIFYLVISIFIPYSYPLSSVISICFSYIIYSILSTYPTVYFSISFLYSVLHI